MKAKTIHHLLSILLILMIISFPARGVYAQGGEVTDEFEEDSLQGWEHSEGVKVSGGVLQISPGNFAIRFDEHQPESIRFDFKRSGSGAIIFRYLIGEGREYTLIIHDSAIILEAAQDGPATFLGESSWDPAVDEWNTIEIDIGPAGQQIMLNGSALISTSEEEVLAGGGIGFWVEGEAAVEFDNLTRVTNIPPSEESTGAEQPEQPSVAEGEISPPAGADEEADRLTVDGLISELSSSQANPTQLSTFLINLGLSVALSYILSRVYIHWGSSLSNRRRFAANFILITVTTTFIILVVRSSVALSLGLVGALSIVRFRSAIKEPEELAYLFFAIAIGIGLGDNQRLITVIALATAIFVLGIMRLFRGRQADFNLHLTIVNTGSGILDFDSAVECLKSNTSQMKLIRFDETAQAQEVSFLVEFRDMEQLKDAKTALRTLSKDLEISFLDNKGIW